MAKSIRSKCRRKARAEFRRTIGEVWYRLHSRFQFRWKEVDSFILIKCCFLFLHRSPIRSNKLKFKITWRILSKSNPWSHWNVFLICFNQIPKTMNPNYWKPAWPSMPWKRRLSTWGEKIRHQPKNQRGESILSNLVSDPLKSNKNTKSNDPNILFNFERRKERWTVRVC